MQYSAIRTRLEILEEFNASPNDAWFGQETVAAIQNRSESSVERDRWLGIGVPFVKYGRCVRYRKADILEWLNSQIPVQSTTEAQSKAKK